MLVAEQFDSENFLNFVKFIKPVTEIYVFSKEEINRYEHLRKISLHVNIFG
jgi:hypothetical protein